MKTRSKKIREIYRVACIRNGKHDIQDCDSHLEAILFHKCNLAEKLNSRISHLKFQGRKLIN